GIRDFHVTGVQTWCSSDLQGKIHALEDGRRGLVHDFPEGARNPAGAWKIRPLVRMRIRRVPPGDTLDGCFQVIEAMLLDQGRELDRKSVVEGKRRDLGGRR